MLKLNKKYKSGTALSILQEAILFSDIQGEITQNEIALSLGTSRMPVREALISLEYQGLIMRLPSQHIKVITFTNDNIRNIFHDLAVLEIDALEHWNNDNIENLLSCKMQTDFHQKIIEHSNTALRKKVLDILINIYLAFVLKHSQSLYKIEAMFIKLLSSISFPIDLDIIKINYDNYCGILADELIKIRNEKKVYSEC